MPLISTRIARLEQSRPARGACLPELDLPPDTCARIAAALAADTFPRSLPDGDLLAILHADDAGQGQP